MLNNCVAARCVWRAAATMTVLGRFLEGFLTGVAVTLVLTLALPAAIVACYRRWKRRSSARYHELQPMGLSGNTYSETVRVPLR